MHILKVSEKPRGETLRVPVLKVFDGDGFLTQVALPGTTKQMEFAVRFGFIDAPELGQPGGREAKHFLSRLIRDQWLNLAILVKCDTNKVVDAYRRMVAVPYLNERAIGGETIARRLASKLIGKSMMRNIELEMVLNGWAWVMDRYGPDDRYYDALEDARQHRRGIWARDDAVDPWDFKKQKYRARAAKCVGWTKPAPPAVSAVRPEAPACPTKGCSGHLVKRNGRYGAFYGCSTFPRCKHTLAVRG